MRSRPACPNMAVGSGHVGVSLLVDPADYVRAVSATVTDVTDPDELEVFRA